MAYLLDNPNPNGSWFYPIRNECKHGRGLHLIVVHTAENLPDWDGSDEGAEKVARYAATTSRKVSWHSTVDSDSTIRMLPDSYTAWHASSYNRCSLGIEIATQAAKWTGSPEAWRYAILRNAAKVVGEWCRAHGIQPIRIPKSVADAGGRGIIAHGDLDPTRRTDPGAAFPWNWFIDEVKKHTQAGVEKTPIVGPISATIGQAVGYWQKNYENRSKYTVETVRAIAVAYWQIAPEYGVDAALAFAQALKETGGFGYGNLVQSTQWNFAGIGATGPGQPGLSFPSIRAGVRAHLLRLAMYAKGTENLYDLSVLGRALPKHLWGSSPNVEDLNGRWAVPGVGYGESVRDHYLKPLRAFVVSSSSGSTGSAPAVGEVPPLSPDEIQAIRRLLASRA